MPLSIKTISACFLLVFLNTSACLACPLMYAERDYIDYDKIEKHVQKKVESSKHKYKISKSHTTYGFQPLKKNVESKVPVKKTANLRDSKSHNLFYFEAVPLLILLIACTKFFGQQKKKNSIQIIGLIVISVFIFTGFLWQSNVQF